MLLKSNLILGSICSVIFIIIISCCDKNVSINESKGNIMNSTVLNSNIVISNPQEGGLELKSFNDSQLQEVPAWPKEIVLSDNHPIKHWEAVVHKSEDIVGIVYKSHPGKLAVTEYPYDQTVLILEGRLILTPNGGQSIEYKPGDVFLFPKTFRGTWEMPETYKEYITVNRKAWEAAE